MEALEPVSNTHWLFALTALLLLSSCIAVKDIGPYWDKGFADPALAGSWIPQAEDKRCIELIKDGNEYTTDKKMTHLRTLQLQDHTFLMLRSRGKNENDELFKYTTVHDSWTLYKLDKNKREEFLRLYNTPNVIIYGTDAELVTINVLNDATIKLLQELAGKPDYWEVVQTYQRGACDLNANGQ